MTQEVRNRLFDQFESSVIDHGWAQVSCARLAHGADVDLHEAYKEYPTRFSYVSDLIRRIDRTMLDDFDTALADEPARDRLFDVLMGRFDAMQEHRALIVSLSKAAKYDPMLVMHLCALSAVTGEWIMEMAHIPSAGLMGQVRNKGALLAYGRAFATWLEDESEDLSRTMAVLDKVLNRGERALRKTEKMLCRMNRLRKCCSRSSSKDRKSSRRASRTASSVDDSEGLATVS